MNDFDVYESYGSTNNEMEYPEVGGMPCYAVLSRETVNSHGFTASFFLVGFSFHTIRDAEEEDPPARVHHLHDILNWFDHGLGTPTGIEDKPPSYATELYQNYPNPFNPMTTIKFSLKERARVSLNVYDVTGQLVRILLDEVRKPGLYGDVMWDGTNDGGRRVASGLYFYRLEAGDYIRVRKMIILR